MSCYSRCAMRRLTPLRIQVAATLRRVPLYCEHPRLPLSTAPRHDRNSAGRPAGRRSDSIRRVDRSFRQRSNKRTRFEEEHHLARQLSQFPDITPQIEATWGRQLQKDHLSHCSKVWVPPDYIDSAPPYEREALEQIHKKSFQANVLLEIRDVRVPSSSHHPSFTRLARHRLHLICYTHADIIDAPTRDRVEAWTLESWPDARCIFVDVREHRPITDKTQNKEEKEGVWDLVYDSLLHHLEQRGGMNCALTVGVANTGKSSLLMSLLRTARRRGELSKTTKARVATGSKRKNKKTKLMRAGPVGIEDKPGKTRTITEYLLKDSPKFYFLDVPGLTPPKFFWEERPQAWFSLAAVNLLPSNAYWADDVDIQTHVCDYVLHCMNRDNNFAYVRKLGLSGPTQDIELVLNTLKKKHTDRMKPEQLQLKRCETFLKLMNTGNFGPVVLDDLSEPYEVFQFKDHHFAKNKEKYIQEDLDFDSDSD